MIGGRAKQILKNAKPIAKYNSKTSNSIPAPPQPPPTPSVPTFSPPSPTPRSPPPVPHKANPTLLLSTLHKNPSFSSEPRDDSVFNNTSNGSSYGSKSNMSGIVRLDGLNETQDNTEEPPQTSNEHFAENVFATSNVNQSLRRTFSGGIRNTPRRAASMKGKSNLVRGGNKKVDRIENIGEFTTKYKATERTKHLITKHGKETAEHLLKLNNSEVDGLNEKENGFVLIYKCGDKAFIVSEGQMGKNMIEDEKYRSEVFENAKNVEIKLETPMLTSILKTQYASKRKVVSTPKASKRANYRGIGGATKRKRINVEETDENPRSSKSQKKNPPPKENDKSNEDLDDSNDDLDEAFLGNDDEQETRWLQSLIREEMEPEPSLQYCSKPPKKQAKQLYPFNCSECPAKYKTRTNFEKHLRTKHGLQ